MQIPPTTITMRSSTREKAWREDRGKSRRGVFTLPDGQGFFFLLFMISPPNILGRCASIGIFAPTYPGILAISR